MSNDSSVVYCRQCDQEFFDTTGTELCSIECAEAYESATGLAADQFEDDDRDEMFLGELFWEAHDSRHAVPSRGHAYYYPEYHNYNLIVLNSPLARSIEWCALRGHITQAECLMRRVAITRDVPYDVVRKVFADSLISAHRHEVNYRWAFKG